MENKLGIAASFTLIFLLSNTPAAQAQSWMHIGEALVEQAREGRLLKMRPMVEPSRRIYVDRSGGESFILHRGEGLFPLRHSEIVQITGARAHGDHVELEIRSTRLGSGRIDFWGTPPASPAEFETYLDEVFEVHTPGSDFFPYVGNRASRTLHIRGANHLPEAQDRETFASADEGVKSGYDLCNLCFSPPPDVPDYGTEYWLATLFLQQVPATYYPVSDPVQQASVTRVGQRVLDGWPVPLRGYRYRFQLLDTDDVNAFAAPTGHILVTRGLLEALETEEELVAILAHEIAHVESRHGYDVLRESDFYSGKERYLRVDAGRVHLSQVEGMALVAAHLFRAGHGLDREREADLFATFYLTESQIGDRPLVSALRKLQAARDAVDPFGEGRALLGPHPDIRERLKSASATVTRSFPDDAVFNGLTADGTLVATLRFDMQLLYVNEQRVLATLSTTAELGGDDTVSGIRAQVDDKSLRLTARTGGRISPSDEVSVVFRNDEPGQLIDGAIDGIQLSLRNVDRWERAVPPQ